MFSRLNLKKELNNESKIKDLLWHSYHSFEYFVIFIKKLTWYVANVIMNLTHFHLFLTWLSHIVPILSLRAASISSTFAKYVFHIWLKGWVFHRMTFTIIYHALKEMINYIRALVLNCCLINVPWTYCMGNPLANSLCDNKNKHSHKTQLCSIVKVNTQRNGKFIFLRHM